MLSSLTLATFWLERLQSSSHEAGCKRATLSSRLKWSQIDIDDDCRWSCERCGAVWECLNFNAQQISDEQHAMVTAQATKKLLAVYAHDVV